MLPGDTGRKLNVHKMSRRRPGRLLNVLCTFNLRPLSTGLFAIFNNSKDWGIVKPDLTILYLKEWMLINGKSFQVKCYEIGYAELSEKSDFFQELPAPKKVSLLKK